MKIRYEYKMLPNTNVTALNAAGEEGWEVVSENDYKWTLMRRLERSEE